MLRKDQVTLRAFAHMFPCMHVCPSPCPRRLGSLAVSPGQTHRQQCQPRTRKICFNRDGHHLHVPLASTLDWIPMAALVSYHKLGSRKQDTCIFLLFWRPKFCSGFSWTSKMSTGMVSSWEFQVRTHFLSLPGAPGCLVM